MYVYAILLVVAAIMMAVELKNPARKWPQVASWWLRAAAMNACQIFIVWVSGSLWDAWMHDNRPWSADWLGTCGGAIVGFLSITFADYWWHRARHRVPFLWRLLHQMHHSAQRVEVATTFYRHPLEIVVSGILVSGLLYIVVGLSIPAATYALLIAAVVQMFYHWNISTPVWLGYIVQRPESHCLHHQEGLHHYNYSDLPLWDWLFGTFVNPKKFAARCGFGEAEQRFGEMLVGMKVCDTKHGEK